MQYTIHYTIQYTIRYTIHYIVLQNKADVRTIEVLPSMEFAFRFSCYYTNTG